MPPPELVLGKLLHVVLPALGVAAVVMAAILLAGGSKQGPLGAALGLAAGAALVSWLENLWPVPPASSSWNRLPWAALAALWIGRVARLPTLPPATGVLLRAGAAILIGWLVLPADLRQDNDWLAPAFATLVFAHWSLLERVAADAPGGSVPFCLAIVFLGAGAVLIHASAARGMDSAAALASALAGLAFIAWWWQADAGGAVPATAVMLPGLLLLGQQETTGDVPWYAFLLPALAPLLLVEALPMSRWEGRRWRLLRLAVMLLLVLIPIVAAVAIAHVAAPMDDAGY
jgi:hypothetical protein